MTREELILYGKDYLHDLETACCKIEEKHKEFVRESIKALEQETVSRETYESEYLARKQAEYELWKIKEQQSSEDCVDREELKKWLDMNFSFGGALRKIELFDRLDKELPPVTPTHKKGKWVVEDSGNYNGKYSTCYCSNCKDYYTRAWREMNFCPNCGAEMEDEE